MIKEFDFFDLFDKFITESRTGKRLKKDGSRLRPGTFKFYFNIRKELFEFSQKKDFYLRIRDVRRLNSREHKSEKAYWKRFHNRYADYLFSKGCFDNYVGAHFKVIRTFFNYVNHQKGIFTGELHRLLYVRNEHIPIIVLGQDQLQFLIHDREFESSLPAYLIRTKDIFVFGCTVGLRFSDLMSLKKQNLDRRNGSIYLTTRSIKTSTDTRIKLPGYAIDIVKKYSGLPSLIPKMTNKRLNLNLKELCEKAGWTQEVGKIRERRGITRKINLDGNAYRFCDLVTTHTMRRTAITTLLSQGMPEIMVRKLSGHAAGSKEFYRYVTYAQTQIDKEVDRIFSELNKPPKQEEKYAEIR